MRRRPTTEGAWKTIVVLPDSHSMHEMPNTRYNIAGEYIASLLPDYVVDIGDFGDMVSLCGHSSALERENKRLIQDIASAKQARALLTAPIQCEIDKRERNHKTRYTPRLIALGGNHDARANKFIKDHPFLEGVFEHDISGAVALGWELYPFGEIVTVEDIDFCHYFVSGNMGRAVGGKNIGATLLRTRHRSSVQGHSHLYDCKMEKLDTGKSLLGLSVGCFLDHDMGYAGIVNRMWWSGLVVLRTNGHDIDVEQVSYARLVEWYKNLHNRK